ncbi:deoxynucleoside monophosphate kinase [Arthrobacter phage VroomVroom]|uniref:Deoxynucleoside monophosphate kinase n=1 Tax=Arthrobacter phage VroomVroom TaxID=3049371 RepID=A0AA49FAE2_9CAUD|nr:deoxynucleoside monophosphate kinase [Arthrobacter phage VroomVroom]
MRKHPVVGMIGRKRVGKDTFADTLVAEYGFTRVSLAGPLKDAALRLNPIVGPSPIPGGLGSDYRRLADVVEAIGWEKAKDFVPGVRETLQRLGTDAIRAIDDTFWIRAAVKAIDAIDGPVVITDVRFPNEADMIQALAGYTVRIERSLPDDGDVHPSETALDNFVADFHVHNDGPLEDLQDHARYIADHVGSVAMWRLAKADAR